MKISNLAISNYKQFKNLELDLTYPLGHDKEGQPLDKICIIGQSGTGKTNLLEIIKKSVIDFSDIKNLYKPFTQFSEGIDEDKYITSTFITKSKEEVKTLLTPNKSTIEKKDIVMSGDEKNYFIGAKELFSSFRILIIEDINQIKLKSFTDKYIINFNDKDQKTWQVMKTKIDNYQKDRSILIETLSNKLFQDDKYSKQDYKEDVLEWEMQHENLLEKIALDINEVFKRFNLKLLSIDENQTSYSHLKTQDLSTGKIIDYEDLSTGTKNLLSTFIPLKTYSPQNSIILIDEPENSFYPDIQKELTSLYSNVGENNQLVFATHSPLIASSFEPWEVVELKFDADNQIYRELYYKDKNHVDNYFLDPRMLTWTSILTDVFDLKEDSNFTFREKGLMAYATLKAEIKALTDTEEKNKKFEELQKLSKKLGLYN